ncbi:MAG TPA: VWA domain-containing protein [Acidobacteriota bacterium]|nr:VWA domain-containing protein [Acidobacteriota bacterium]
MQKTQAGRTGKEIARDIWNSFPFCWMMLLAATALLNSPAAANAETAVDSGAGYAQPAIDTHGNAIRVTSTFVSVPVSVTSIKGSAVQGLTIDDFLVLEDGVPVTISRMSVAARSPLQLALLVDISGSIHDSFELERKAAIRFLEKVWKPGDMVSILSFSGHTEMHLENFGHVSEALRKLALLEPEKGPTALYDAIVETAGLMNRTASDQTRRAMIVFSDGADNRSDHCIRRTLDAVQRSNILFYSINSSGASVRLNSVNRRGQENMEELAAAGGGMAFVIDSTSDADHIFNAIATDFSAQYLLSYYSPNPYKKGTYRHIKVSLPGKSEVRIRARRGYYTALDSP